MRSVFKTPMSVFLLLLTMSTVHAVGQVTPAQRGGGNQANAFGMFTANQPDYDHPFTYGATFGADYRVGAFRFGQPGIAVRVSIIPGGIVGEDTYLIGPEWHMRYARFRPYGDFHVGLGHISYSNRTEERNVFKVNSRSGLTNEFGGGVDYRLTPKFGLRLADFQYQFWSVGTGDVIRVAKPPIIHGAITYTPYQFSSGVYYRFR